MSLEFSIFFLKLRGLFIELRRVLEALVILRNLKVYLPIKLGCVRNIYLFNSLQNSEDEDHNNSNDSKFK
jgi:uncharacterized membrane protein YbhN (UPF0104 family)